MQAALLDLQAGTLKMHNSMVDDMEVRQLLGLLSIITLTQFHPVDHDIQTKKGLIVDPWRGFKSETFFKEN